MIADKCYVCKQLVLTSKRDVQRETSDYVFEVTCAYCGTYLIHQKLISAGAHGDVITAEERFKLSHRIRTATDAGGSFQEILDVDNATQNANVV